MSDQTKAADLATWLENANLGYAANVVKSQAERIAELEAALTLTPEKIEAAESAALRYDGELQNGPIVAALLAAGFQEPAKEQS